MPTSPILLIMAAGMGSRYGGLKQMDPIGPDGELLLDYSLFDAKRAGFKRAVIVIKRENEADFRQVLGDRVSKHMPITYAYQELTNLPDGFSLLPERTKPLGTGHAVLSASQLIDAPFCVINADDFYGVEAFQLCYSHLTQIKHEGDIAMVGYFLKNTLSETGHVARGICSLDAESQLTNLVERTHIISTVDGPLMTEDMETYTALSPDRVVSMNMWGFPASTMAHIERAFPLFLQTTLRQNPLKAEFFLPSIIDELLRTKKASTTVYTTPDKWYGVTYQEDKAKVQNALRQLAEEGIYPRPLWV